MKILRRDLQEANTKLCDQQETTSHKNEMLQDNEQKITDPQEQLQNLKHNFIIIKEESKTSQKNTGEFFRL